MPTNGTIYKNQERLEAVVRVLQTELDRQTREWVGRNKAIINEAVSTFGISDEDVILDEIDPELVIEVPVSWVLTSIPLAVETLRVRGITNTLDGEGGEGETQRAELDQIQDDYDRDAKIIFSAIAQILSQGMDTEEEVLRFGEQLEEAGARVTVDIRDDDEE